MRWRRQGWCEEQLCARGCLVEPLTELAPDEIAAELRPAVEALVASHAADAE